MALAGYSLRHRRCCRVAAVAGMLLAAAPVSAVRIVVDNTDSGFSILSGTWNTATTAGRWGTDFRTRTTATTVTGEVQWQPSLSTAGSYEVAVWYQAGSTRPNNATYTVYYNGGSTNVVVNQQINGSTWVVLGTFNFAAGTTGRVTLSNKAQSSKTIAADAVRFATGPDFRAMWIDVFHDGLQNAAQIDQMIGYAVQARYNAIIPEVLAFHDNNDANGRGEHGAYWRSNTVARSPWVTDTFDPLAYMVQQAHANGIEVHPWLVAFRLSAIWPPPGNTFLEGHPEWLMVPSGSMGTVAKVSNYYTFDPGCPEVQDYLVSIVQELVNDYAIDGIHWDYIRYTTTDAGYPADAAYTKSSLARFQQITGRTDVPPPTGDAQWNDFRRRSIDELMRRVRAEVPSIRTNPQQPLRHTASLIPWGDAPADFTNSSAYGLFQNWEMWMRVGWMDAGCPMLYFREHCTVSGNDQYTWYRNWVNAALGWRYQRHMFLGQGNYMNSVDNSVIQMTYAANQGANGSLNYSYWATRTTETLCDGVDIWVNDFTWYTTTVPTSLFTQTALTPTMPWRNPATATEGTLWGRVTDVTTGLPIDDATVTVTGMDPVQTDGNGYYVVTMIPAVAGGTAYTVTASKLGDTPRSATGTVYAGDVSVLDLTLRGCETNANCDDGAFCNGAETCDATHLCQGGAAPCTTGTWCNETTDACVAYGNGDFDADADVDLTDYAAFQQCFGQPAVGGCEPGDLTGTGGMVDLDDYVPFEAVLAGP